MLLHVITCHQALLHIVTYYNMILHIITRFYMLLHVTCYYIEPKIKNPNACTHNTITSLCNENNKLWTHMVNVVLFVDRADLLKSSTLFCQHDVRNFEAMYEIFIIRLHRQLHLHLHRHRHLHMHLHHLQKLVRKENFRRHCQYHLETMNGCIRFNAAFWISNLTF